MMTDHELLEELTQRICERFGEPSPLKSFDPFSPHDIAHHGLSLLKAAYKSASTPQEGE